MSTEYYLIGAGLFNAVLANLLAKSGKSVFMFESRDHVGGNCYDEIDETTGIRYHKYGPHIIHLQNNKWFSFLNEFGTLEPFHHNVKSAYRGRLYTIPINLETINDFYGVNLHPYEVREFLKSKVLNIDNPQNMEEKLLSLIGKDLYEAFFRSYTIKQWEKDPTNLPESTIQRIPVRLNFNSSYYTKKFSYIPKEGFTNLICNLLNHRNISVSLNTNIGLKEIENFARRGTVIYSGEVDRLFGYRFGELEYRSLYFVKEYKDVSDYQGISVVNYPELNVKWTRICEPVHFPHTENEYKERNKTLLIKEFSCRRTGNMEAYYPISNTENLNLYNLYVEEAKKIRNLRLAGRLGMYKYTDMENTIENAFRMFENV